MTGVDSRNNTGRSRRFGLVLAVVGWVVIGVATLTPTASGHSQVSAWCLACGPGWSADALANLLLFLPLGAGLALARVRARLVFPLVAFTTLAIEVLQLRVVTGRDASLSDLLMNFAGGTIGYLAFRSLGTLLHPPSTRALALAVGWAACWLTGTAVTAWALAPSLPASLWWAHWRVPADVPPGGPSSAPVTLAVSVGGTPLERGRLPQWPTVRQALLTGEALTLRAIIAPPVSDRDRQIVLLDDADSEAELVSVRRNGNGVSFFFRTRVALLRLRPPAIWSGDFLPPTGIDTAVVRASLTAGKVHLEAVGTHGRVRRVLALSPNWGWSFLVPPRFALGPEVRLVTAFWIAGLVFPIAFWAAQHRASRYGPAVRLVTLATVAAPGFAFCIVPAAFGLPWVHWSEWLAWVASSAIAWIAGQRMARGPAGEGRDRRSIESRGAR